MTEQTTDCADARLSLGALVLGALEPGDREVVEAHVHGCRGCSETLAELAPVPGLLNRVDTADLELAPPPPELLERVLAVVRAEERASISAPSTTRRRARWAVMGLGGAVAAGLLVVLALVWTGTMGASPPRPGLWLSRPTRVRPCRRR